MLLVFLNFAAAAKEGIMNTKHNLSFSGPGEIKSLTETEICIFCHTPHNAVPQTPLWNKPLKPVNYVPYASTTIAANPSQPNGPSRLCLSCHDGTVALGEVLRPQSGIAMRGTISMGGPSYLGTILSGDHPFSFSYNTSVLNPLAGLFPALPADLIFYGNGFIECSTCHDAHEDAYKSPDLDGKLTGKFLVADNRYSALCTKCHSAIDGWQMGTHKTTATVRPLTRILPVPPKKWPTWTTAAEWGCESCHTSHSAGAAQRLLYFQEEEKNCYLCHDGNVATKNIKAQFQKISRHPVEATAGIHDPKERPAWITNRHVECVDCHNPHAANGRTATPPYVSGRLEKVSGLDMNRVGVDSATYEYEICFKCHSDLAPQVTVIPRVVNTANKRLAFDLINPSYHPVEGTGRNPSVPSIPSQLAPTLSTSSIIYCTDCHSDDNGMSSGPHGSAYYPILRDRYETTDGTTEMYQNYALCYRCHNRDSILRDDSFKKNTLANKGGHSGHLAAGAPCSACHDAHGIQDNHLSGNHTHLINFDIRIVSPLSQTPPNNVPLYIATGTFSGNCTLICHGVKHSLQSYP